MEFIELKIDSFQETIKNAILKQENYLLYSIIPANIVYAGKGDIDEDYCKKHDYLVYPSIDFGKGLVATKGDVVVVLIIKNGWEEGFKIIKEIIEFLKSKNINASLQSNDIMIDGIYKVASFSSVNVGNNTIYTGFQATFNPNIKDIECICKRPLVKIPKGLSDFGISPEEILHVVMNLYK